MEQRPADPLYLELKRELAADGWFARDTPGYVRKTTLLVALFTVPYVALLYLQSTWQVAIALFVMGHATVQLAYISHDAGHRAISDDKRVIAALGHFGMTLLTGFSFSWWMHSHGNHHSNLNERDNDLAMKYSAVLAVHEEGARVRRGWKRQLTRWQAYYIWLLLPFYHFAMMWDGLLWVAKNPRTTRLDQLVLPLYVGLWFVLPSFFIGPQRAALHWLADSVIGSLLISLTFIVHHVGKKVIDPDEDISLIRQQVDCTRSVNTWRVFDFYYCGLNIHIPHHLFPWAPHWRYRAMGQAVRAFCERHGIVYREEGFWEAIANVFRHLKRMGEVPTYDELDDLNGGFPAADRPAPTTAP
jgi:fatty acid desaturase